MQLRLPAHLGEGYESPRQRIRVITEAWGEFNLFCGKCGSRFLRRARHNTAGIDFVCRRCEDPYQLKSQAQPIGRRIPDAAYGTMRRIIREGNAPSIFALHYDEFRWTVRNLLLIPRFAVSLSFLHRRKPTLPKGRGRPWVGCDFVLDRIPTDAKIPVVIQGTVIPVSTVRERFLQVRRLGRQRQYNRGWTMDVLNIVRKVQKREFLLAEVYEHIDELRQLHPRNRHIDDKIRQQLQRLRDLGFLQFLRPGHYRLRR